MPFALAQKFSRERRNGNWAGEVLRNAVTRKRNNQQTTEEHVHYVKRLCATVRQWVCYTNGSANMRRSANVSDIKCRPCFTAPALNPPLYSPS